MNVFWHELRMRRTNTIIWTVTMLIFMVVCMAKYETITAQGGAAITTMFKAFPASVQAIFGMSGLDLTTVAGYFGVCFLFMAVILAVHAGLTGAGVIAQEEADKTAEFLYVKPRGRRAIITAKLLAGIVMLIIVWMASVVGSIIGIEKFAHFGDFMTNFWWLMAAAALIQIAFFAFGAMAVTLTKRAGGYGTLVSIAIFGSYFLYVFAKLSSSFQGLHYLSIFSWFDALDILNRSGLSLHYVIATIALSIVMLAVVYLRYPQRDLTT